MKIHYRLIQFAVTYFRVREILIICGRRIEFDQLRKGQLSGCEVIRRKSLNSRLQNLLLS